MRRGAHRALERVRPWALLFALASACAAAEEHEPRTHEPRTHEPRTHEPRTHEPRTEVEAGLFSTDLVSRHRDALELDDAQDEAIGRELARASDELEAARRVLEQERAALAVLLAHERIDEEAALEAAARVVEREGAIKVLHLRLLVRIKNTLSPAQHRMLEDLRARPDERPR